MRLYSYRAQTLSPVLRSGAFVTSGIEWNCSGNICTTYSSQVQSRPVVACLCLRLQVGQISGGGSAMLNAEQLRACQGPVMRPLAPEQIRSICGARTVSGRPG